MRLTDLKLKSLKFEGKQRKIFDDSLPNFGVRLYKSGISFIVMLGADRRMRTIGKYPHTSLKTARTEALRILSVDGAEPSQLFIAEALTVFISHSSTKNKPRTTHDYKRLLSKHLPSGKLSDLDRRKIVGYLNSLKHIPAERSHATTAFQVFFNWCVHNGYMNSNPIMGLRNQGTVRTRDRVLSDKELLQIWNTLSEDRFSTIVRILILTGIRRGEYQYMTIKNGMATIPSEHTKNGREHVFPVSNMAEHYFRHFTFNGWGKSKKRLDDQSGVTDYTLHDLRRTFASTHAQIGTPIHVVEKLLNHVSGSFGGVAGIYNRYSYQDEMKEACAQYEDHIRSLGLG